MDLLKCINLNKSFGNKKILKDINLTIPKGKIIGLLGKNGTGKTTLIKLINDLLTITSGEILINGNPIGVESKKIIDNLKKEYAKELSNKYFTNMESIGFTKTETINYLKEIGGK